MEIDEAMRKAQRNKAWKERVFEEDAWEKQYKDDLLKYGQAFYKDGKRIDPRDFYIEPPPDKDGR